MPAILPLMLGGGMILMLVIIGAFVLFGTAAMLFSIIVAFLWVGTLLYYVFIHKDNPPPSNDYRIDQGKER